MAMDDEARQEASHDSMVKTGEVVLEAKISTTQKLNIQELPEIVVPPIEIGEMGDYEYVPQEEVERILKDEYHYGPTKRLVDALYLHKNDSRAVGILRVTDERCEGHFEGNPVFRGVDQAEFLAQTLLLSDNIKGNIPDGKSPRLTGVIMPTYRNPAVPGMVLNAVVQRGSDVMTGFGHIYNGDKLISEGLVSGTLVDTTISEKLLNRARRQIQAPKFPLK